MRRVHESLVLAVVAALAATAVFTGFRAAARSGEDSPAQEKERRAEAGETPASLLSASRAETLSATEQARAGIRCAPLAPLWARRRFAAAAIVLSAQSLAVSRGEYQSAQAKLETAQVQLGIAQAEFSRARSLYQDNQNVSEKDFQAAQGALRSDQIAVREAQRESSLAADLVRQAWGSAVAGWLERSSPLLDRVLEQNAFLVEVTLPAGSNLAPPATVSLSLSGSRQSRASFVSPLPRVDPRVQGVSLLYQTPAREWLAPGVSLLAEVAEGALQRGVVVPASAVVWLEGEAWVYVQTAPSRFVRRRLAAEFPVNGGVFVSEGFTAGEKVVVAGAETLLSLELSPQSAAPSEGDEDD